MKVQSFHTCEGATCIDIKRGSTLVLSASDLDKKLSGKMSDDERWAYQCAANLLKMTTGGDVRVENEDEQGDAVQMSIFDMMEAA